MKYLFTFFVTFFLLYQCGPKAGTYIGDSRIIFADSSAAAAVVSSKDEYSKYVSSYDRSASLKTTRDVSREEFFKHLAGNVMNWSKDEMEMFKRFSLKADSQLTKLNLNFPDEIILVKTTTNEYGGVTVAYTRQNAIMFTSNILVSQQNMLYEIYLHELFHIYSRQNPEKKEALYKIIGFHQTTDVVLPAEWDARRITNPDAPALNTYIKLSVDGDTATYTPIMYALEIPYDTTRPGGLFQSFKFGLLKVEQKNGQYSPIYFDGIPDIINPMRVKSFWDQIGKNTNYIIHPEEILASNFVFLVTEPDSLPSPDIVDSMRAVILK